MQKAPASHEEIRCVEPPWPASHQPQTIQLQQVHVSYGLHTFDWCFHDYFFVQNRYWRDKLDTHVDFPLEGLDMSPYIINGNHGNAVYDLVAVSNHYGGMGGGHCKNF